MTKKELIENVAITTGFTKKDIATVLNALRDVTYTALKSHDSVKVIDGVILNTRFKEEGVARNPQTGENITVAAKYVPKAKFGAAIKRFINE